MKTVLNIGTQQRGRDLRSQSDPFVDKGIHLLFDNIRGLANGAGKELGFFQNRQTNLLHTETTKNIASCFLDFCQQMISSGRISFTPLMALIFNVYSSIYPFQGAIGAIFPPN